MSTREGDEKHHAKPGATTGGVNDGGEESIANEAEDVASTTKSADTAPSNVKSGMAKPAILTLLLLLVVLTLPLLVASRTTSKLQSVGVPRAFLCHPTSKEYEPYLVHCGDQDHEKEERFLQEVLQEEEEVHDTMFCRDYFQKNNYEMYADGPPECIKPIIEYEGRAYTPEFLYPTSTASGIRFVMWYATDCYYSNMIKPAYIEFARAMTNYFDTKEEEEVLVRFYAVNYKMHMSLVTMRQHFSGVPHLQIYRPGSSIAEKNSQLVRFHIQNSALPEDALSIHYGRDFTENEDEEFVNKYEQGDWEHIQQLSFEEKYGRNATHDNLIQLAIEEALEMLGYHPTQMLPTTPAKELHPSTQVMVEEEKKKRIPSSIQKKQVVDEERNPSSSSKKKNMEEEKGVVLNDYSTITAGGPPTTVRGRTNSYGRVVYGIACFLMIGFLVLYVSDAQRQHYLLKHTNNHMSTSIMGKDTELVKLPQTV